MSGWTDERIERLKRYWAEGHSASQIAALLGSVTRNGVLGKAWRLGLASKERTSQSRMEYAAREAVKKINRQSAKKAAPSESRKSLRDVLGEAEPLPVAVEEIVVPEAKRVGVDGLQDQQCRWGIGDPQHAGFHFCHHDKLAGLPYCQHHARRAWQPPKPREDRGIQPVGRQIGTGMGVGSHPTRNAPVRASEREREDA